MNSLLEIYRQHFPEDMRGDDEITVDLAKRYPNVFAKYPDAQKDLTRINDEIAEAMKPTTGDKVKQAIGSTVRGVTETFADVPKSIHTGAMAVQEKVPLPGVEVNGEFPYVHYKTPSEMSAAYKDEQAGGDSDSIVAKTGEAISSLGKKITPDEVPELNDSFWATKVPSTLGSIGAFMAGGGLAKALTQGSVKAVIAAAAEDAAKEALSRGATEAVAQQAAEYAAKQVAKHAAVKFAEMIPTGAMGAATQAQGGYEEAIAKGATPEQAFNAYLLNIPIGAAMALPAHQLLGEGQNLVSKLVRDTLTGTGVMAGQQIASNAAAKATYDPNRDLTAGVGEGAGAGAIVTAALSALSHGLMGKKAAEAEKPEINPADNYKLPDADREKVLDVLNRELSGERSQSLETALASVLADPNLNSFYTLEKQRLMNEAKGGEINGEEEEIPQQGNEGLLSQPQISASETITGSNEGKASEMPAAAGAIPAPTRTEPNKPDQQSRLNELRRQAATTALHELPEPAFSSPVTDYIARKRQAAIDARAKQVDTAVVQDATAEKTTALPPTATIPAAPESGVPGAAGGTAAPAAVRVDTAPVAQAPLWQKLQAQPNDVINRVAFGEAQLKGQAAGLGKKSAEAFIETAEPDELYKDVSANKNDRNTSRKLGVFLSPDNSHVLIGTAYENGRGDAARKVTFFNQEGKPQAVQFRNLTAAGYKLIASIKTTEPTKGYAVTYSPEVWARMAEDLRTQKQAARGTAAAMEEHLRQSGVQGREAEKDVAAGNESELAPKLEGLVNADDVAEAEAAAPVQEIKGFTTDHAGAIFDALAATNGLEGEAWDKAFVTSIAESKRAYAAIEAAMKSITRATGEKPDVAFEVLRSAIYDTAKSSGDSKGAFNKTLLSELHSRVNENGGAESADRGRAGGSAVEGSGSEGTQAGAVTGSKAEEVAAAAANVDTNPTEAQKASGNYRKGHVTLDGLDITIENPKGSTRTGTDANGQPWQVEMPAHYGYVKGTEGRDGDHVDVYIGEHPESDKVFVVDQIDPKTGKFDEHKAMLGFNSREEAVSSYIQGFSDGSGPARLGEITEMPKDEFVDWVNEGDTNRPLSYGKKFKSSPALVRFSERDANLEHLATGEEMRSRWNDVLQSAEANGLNISVLQGLHEGGVYSPRSVVLTVADPINPTADNVTLLLHEIGHEEFNWMKLPAAMETAFHRAIEKLSKPEDFNIKIAPGENQRAVTAEEILVERVARNLVAEGFTPTQASSGAARLINFVKRMYYRSVLAIQRAVLGDEHVSPQLAQRYFEERVKAFLTGGQPMSFISFIGGPKLTQEQRGELFTPAGGDGAPSGVFNFETGGVDYRAALPETMAALRYNEQVARGLDEGDNYEARNDRRNQTQRFRESGDRAAGETNLRAAADVLRGDHRADEEIARLEQTKSPREAAQLNRAIAEKQETALTKWAEANKLMLDYAPIARNLKEFAKKAGEDEPSTGGAEHEIYEDGQGNFIKLNPATGQGKFTGGMHSNWLDYFNRLAIHKALFPETAYDLLGFTRDDSGKLYAVVKQRVIRGEPATRAEVEAYMQKFGFHRFRDDEYYSPERGIIVGDLHDENVVKLPDGTIEVYDPVIEVAKPLDFERGGYLSREQKPAQFINPKEVIGVRYSERTTSPAFTQTGDPHLISRDINSPAKVEEDVAAYNALNDIHAAAFRVFDSIQPGKLTFEQFVEHLTNADTPAANKIKARNEELAANGHRTVDTTLRPHDLLSEASQMQAADKAYRYAWGLREFWNDRRKSAEWFLKTAEDKLNRSNIRLHELMKRYTDMDLQFANTKEELKSIHDDFQGDIKGSLDTARKVGALTQVIAQIDGRMSDPAALAKQYAPVVNRLYAKISGDNTGKFMETLQRVAELHLDWKTIGSKEAAEIISDIIAPTDPELAHLENRAMAAITVAFAKANEHVMSFLELSRSSALEERAKLNEILKEAVSDNKDAIQRAKELARKLPKLAVTADRLLTKLQELKAEHYAHMDEMQRAKTFTEFHDAALPVLQGQMVQLEKTIGARLQTWEPVNNAEYFVAPKANASADQVMQNKKVFKLSSAGSDDALREHIKQNNEWLANVPEDQRGAVWNTVNEMTRKLESQLGISDHVEIKRSVVNTFFGSMVDKLESTGIPALRSAAKRLRLAMAERHAATHDADPMGIKWMAAEAKAMAALGVKDIGTEKFQRLFFQSALSFAEKNPDIRAAFKGDKEAFEALLPRLKQYLERDPDTREQMQKPGAWNALENYYRASYANMEFVNGLRKKLGLKIQEQGPDGFKIEREPIGSTFYTAMRRISRDAVRMYHDMRELGWLGTEDGKLNAKDVTAAYAKDPAALSDQVKPMFIPDVWREFVQPLAQMEGRSAFYGPERVDGLSPLALRENVAKAFALANGDAVKFAESLHDLESIGHDIKESRGEFVGKTLQAFQDYFDSIHNTQKDFDDGLRHGLPTPPRLLQDARISESWPGEWMDYQTYGRWEMHQMVNLLTQQAAYGRNMEAMRRDLQSGIADLQAKAEKFRKITQRIQDTNPGKSKRTIKELIRQEVERQGDSYTALSEASRNAQMARNEAKQFEALLQSQNGLAMELRWFQELVGSLAGATVQGPGTALFQFADFGQAFAKLGLGKVAVGTLRRSLSSLAGEAFGTLAQAFHLQIKLNADQNARRVRNGIVDPDARRRFGEVMTAVMHDTAGDMGNPLTRNVTRGARLLRVLTSSGIGRAEGGENAYVTLKPHAIFSQFTLQQTFALMDGWVGAFEDMIGRAVDYFKDPKNSTDLNDPRFQFANHKQLGYSNGVFGIGSDERAFSYLNSALNRNGMSLETLARDAIKRGDGKLINDEQFRALAALVQNEITLDSSPATRPSAFFTNPVLHLANPLLGWSIAKSHDAWESWRRPDMSQTSRNFFKAFTTGVRPYLALVPIGLALAWLREEYDEKILNKKANRALPNTFGGLVDAMARVGNFGVFGDVANSYINRDTERPFSVDNRVFFISSMMAAKSALQNWFEQGSADYQTVYRPLLAALGGSGYLQYAQIVNHALSLDNAEARVTSRLNAMNYLRVVGRELNLDVRLGSSGDVISNPIKPYVGQMLLASYANDPTAFREAMRNAVAAARAEKKPDPEDYVQRSFAAYNPLRLVFRTEPSEAEYQQILRALPEDGRVAVATAVRNFNHYAVQIGAKASFGKTESASTGGGTGGLTLQQMRQRMFGVTPNASTTLDNLRRLAAGY